MDDLLYCYPHSNVLRNKLGITEQEKLQEAERKLTAIRIYDLIRRPIKGGFDLDHLCSIHYYIFQDLYTWAGEIRKTDIAKGNLFCRVEHIHTQADFIFNSIRKDHYLERMDRGLLAKRFAYYFSEINALHPFREGNGRTQREFVRELALYNHYAIDFSAVTSDEMLEASVESFLCRYDKMKVIFDKCLRKTTA